MAGSPVKTAFKAFRGFVAASLQADWSSVVVAKVV